MKTSMLVLLAATACSSTSVVSSWRKPGADLRQLDRLTVLMATDNESLRRSAEDQVAAALPGLDVTPSYLLTPNGAPPKRDQALQAAIDAGGFDGALVMRIVAVEREARWVPA